MKRKLNPETEEESDGKKKKVKKEDVSEEITIWLGPALANVENAVASFCERWIPLPKLIMPFEVMDQGQLRDALGIRVNDLIDLWPKAERMLMEAGFRWHILGNSRVIYMREREDTIEDDGYDEVEEVNEE